MQPRNQWGMAGMVLLVLWSSGCGGAPAELETPRNIAMEEIGKMVQQHMEQKKSPPRQVEDLADYEPGFPAGFAALTMDQAVLYFGQPVTDKGNAAKTILAYEKKVESEEGYVLMQDGKVRKMTPEEFKAAPRARK